MPLSSLLLPVACGRMHLMFLCLYLIGVCADVEDCLDERRELESA